MIEFNEVYERKIIIREKIFTVRKSDKTGSFTIGNETFYCRLFDVIPSDTFLFMCEKNAFDSKKFGFDSNKDMFDFYLQFLESQAYLHSIEYMGISYGEQQC